VDGDGAVGKFGVGVSTVEEEIPGKDFAFRATETRVGCTGGHVSAVDGKVSIRGLGIE